MTLPDFFNTFDYMFYFGTPKEKIIAILIVAVPICLLAYFAIRADTKKEKKQ